MTPSAASTTGQIARGRYQPCPSNVRMKLRRYSVSGASQSSGTDATFCVRWLVTASNSADPVADSPIQRRYGDFESSEVEDRCCEASGGVNQATAAHRT